MPRATTPLVDRIRNFKVEKIKLLNYFDKANLALSPSKIKLFKRSPKLFHDTMQGTFHRKVSDPMKRGSVLDAVLSGSQIPYGPEHKGTDQYLVESKYKQAITLAEWELDTPLFDVYREYDAEYQRLLTRQFPDFPACGVADVVVAVGGVTYIDDFKFTTPGAIESPQKYFWQARNMGYFTQLGTYRYLLATEIGAKPEEIVCRIVACTIDEDGVPAVKIFRLQDFDLAAGFQYFIDTACEIMLTKKWDDPKPAFQDDIPLSPMNESV